MITKINDKITIWTKFNLAKLSMENISPPNILFNEEQISINDRWFDVLTPSQLVRKRNKEDGYYRVIYIQINYESGEYYIGKANRPTWKQLVRYQGSGLKFKNKFNKHQNNFVRFYIASCKNSEETELLESSLLTSEILSDEKCLNLVAGGGGLNKHTSSAETSEKKLPSEIEENVMNTANLNPNMNVQGMGNTTFPGDPGSNNSFASQTRSFALLKSPSWFAAISATK